MKYVHILQVAMQHALEKVRAAVLAENAPHQAKIVCLNQRLHAAEAVLTSADDRLPSGLPNEALHVEASEDVLLLVWQYRHKSISATFYKRRGKDCITVQTTDTPACDTPDENESESDEEGWEDCWDTCTTLFFRHFLYSQKSEKRVCEQASATLAAQFE